MDNIEVETQESNLTPTEYFLKYFPESHFEEAARWTNHYGLLMLQKNLAVSP